jgi:hypothetical protein
LQPSRRRVRLCWTMLSPSYVLTPLDIQPLAFQLSQTHLPNQWTTPENLVQHRPRYDIIDDTVDISAICSLYGDALCHQLRRSVSSKHVSLILRYCAAPTEWNIWSRLLNYLNSIGMIGTWFRQSLCQTRLELGCSVMHASLQFFV